MCFANAGEVWLHIDDEAVSTVRKEDVVVRGNNERVEDRCIYILFYYSSAPTQISDMMTFPAGLLFVRVNQRLEMGLWALQGALTFTVALSAQYSLNVRNVFPSIIRSPLNPTHHPSLQCLEIFTETPKWGMIQVWITRKFGLSSPIL